MSTNAREQADFTGPAVLIIGGQPHEGELTTTMKGQQVVARTFRTISGYRYSVVMTNNGANAQLTTRFAGDNHKPVKISLIQ